MATKLYLPSSGSAPATPTFNAGWTDTAQATRYPTDKQKKSTAMTTKSITDSSNAARSVLVGQWVSPLLAVGQTITGAQTVNIQARFQETAANNNLFLEWAVYVMNGNTIQKTVITKRTDGTEIASASLQNRTDSATSVAGNYTTVSGDRIVIEVGMSGDPAGSNHHDGDMRIGDNSASDLASDDTSTTDDNPNLNFVTDTLKWEATLFHTTDADLKASRTLTHTTDADLKGTVAITHTTDSLLKKTQTVSHTTDTDLKGTRTISHTTDADLKGTKTVSHTTDADLKGTRTVSHTTDALLKKTSTVSHTTDADLKGTVTLSHTTDSSLKATSIRTHTTDALLKATSILTHTTDALLKAMLSVWHTTDSLLKATLSVFHTTDALLRKTSTVSHTTDADLKGSVILTHTTDALLRMTSVLSHTTDALLKATLTVSHTTDAFIKKSDVIPSADRTATPSNAGITVRPSYPFRLNETSKNYIGRRVVPANPARTVEPSNPSRDNVTL